VTRSSRMTEAALTSLPSLHRYEISSTPSLILVADMTRRQKPKAKAAPKKAPAAKKTTQTTLKAKPAAKSTAAKKKAKVDSEDELSDAHMSDADSLLSHTPPKSKKAAAPKRAGSKPLADVENESHGGDAADGASKGGNASDKYQKVSQIPQPAG
jgi:DNA topoisomerase-2